jgi:hypothetical protein
MERTSIGTLDEMSRTGSDDREVLLPMCPASSEDTPPD